MQTENPQTGAPYTVPVISTSNAKDWYVFFQFFHAGKVHERKLRKGINRYADLKERRHEAECLRKATEDKLKLGWNPIADPEFKARTLTQSQEVTALSFNAAMDFALEKKKKGKLAKKTARDYKNILAITKEQAVKIGLAFLPVKQVTRLHVLTLMEKLAEDREFSNHRFNMYLGCIRSMFTTLETWTVVEYNPASKIPAKEVAESDKYETFTDAEKQAIAEHLAKHHYRLFVFMQFVYHTGIRPAELLALKVEQIDLKRRVVKLVPDFEQETTKTNFIRPLPINNELFPFIKEMYLEQYPGNFFVFGSPFEPGKGNRGSQAKLVMGQRRLIKANARNGFTNAKAICGAMRTDYLTPSPWQASRDTVTRLWKTLVKDKGSGLGINKCLYAAKHTGADDKILAGIDLDALRNLYGHRSKQMTERYAKQVRELYHSNIIDNSPAFVGGKKPGKLRKVA